jgi:hypothetical protein
MCPMCRDRGWIQSAGLFRKVTAEGERDVVGDFHPIVCFVCQPNYRVFQKASFDNG